MLNRRKKTVSFRGQHSHGYGSKKKHRGSGHQGGVGMAGTGKRSDTKKPSIWKDTQYFGRFGFVSKSKAQKSLNIFYLEDHFATLSAKGKIKKEGDMYVVNLADFNCQKLLSSGNPTRAYKIICESASAAAIKKIEAAKGTIAK